MNSPAARSPRGAAPARILLASPDVLHPCRLCTRLSAPSDWKRSGWPSEVITGAAARAQNKGTRRQRGTKEHEGREAQAIGRECEKVTAAHGVNSFFKETRVLVRETLSRAPQSP
jgi:hypothetical protein